MQHYVKIANEYEALLSKIEGVYDIENDYLLGKEELHIKVNETLAARVGVSVFDIATAVNTGFEGTIATSIQRSDEEVDVRVRFAEKYRKGQNAIREIKRVNRNNQSTVVSKEHTLDNWFVLVNQKNQLIPVAPLVNLTKSKNIRSINHLNGKRVLTITANIDANLVTSTEVTNKVFAMAKAIPPNYPQYTIQAGGEFKDTQDSIASLKKSLGIALIIIFMILVLLFHSILQPFIVLSAVPFALIGVILAFILHNEPLSFLALIGVIGLAGVVINDSIVLIDFANRLRRENPGLTNKEVTIQASSVRLRPVIMTSLTTIGGLLPTAYSLSGYDLFLEGIALAFAWGLLFSTILILGFVPILYNLSLDAKDWWQKKATASCKRSKKELVKVSLTTMNLIT